MLAISSSALAATCPAASTWSHTKGQAWIINATGWQTQESLDPERAKAAINSDSTAVSDYADVIVDIDSNKAICKYWVGFTSGGDNVYAIAVNNSQNDTSKIKQPPFQHAFDDLYECRASNPLALALCSW